MNFKDWKIKVTFHEVVHDNIKDERHEKLLMEASIKYLVSECNFIPRQGDFIHDLEGLREDTPFEVIGVEFKIHIKTLEFILSNALEDEE